MCIFKKLKERKLAEKNVKENECWYNNSHENKRSRWNIPDDSASGFTPNQHDNAIYRSMAKRQR